MGWTRALWLFKYLNGWEEVLASLQCRATEGWELELWCCKKDTAQRDHTTQGIAALGADRSLPAHRPLQRGKRREKTTHPDSLVLSKPLCSPSGRGTTAAPASAAASPAQPGAGLLSISCWRSCSTAVWAAQTLHSSSCTAEQSSLMPIKQSVLSTCECEEEAGAVLLFLSRKCSAAITPRETPRPCQVTMLGKYVDKSQKTKLF